MQPGTQINDRWYLTDDRERRWDTADYTGGYFGISGSAAVAKGYEQPASSVPPGFEQVTAAVFEVPADAQNLVLVWEEARVKVSLPTLEPKPLVTVPPNPTSSPVPTPTPTPTPTATPQPSRSTSFGDGTWVVGADILHGTYRSSRTGGACYWERLSGFSGGFGDIIANKITDELSLVEISSTDAGFSTQDCGTWSKATTRITSSLTSPFGGGAFIVGLDIASGIWRSPGGDSCYWERLSGFSGELKHIEANDVGVFNNIVTIQSTDKGFSSSDCGSWTKQ